MYTNPDKGKRPAESVFRSSTEHPHGRGAAWLRGEGLFVPPEYSPRGRTSTAAAANRQPATPLSGGVSSTAITIPAESAQPSVYPPEQPGINAGAGTSASHSARGVPNTESKPGFFSRLFSGIGNFFRKVSGFFRRRSNRPDGVPAMASASPSAVAGAAVSGSTEDRPPTLGGVVSENCYQFATIFEMRAEEIYEKIEAERKRLHNAQVPMTRDEQASAYTKAKSLYSAAGELYPLASDRMRCRDKALLCRYKAALDYSHIRYIDDDLYRELCGTALFKLKAAEKACEDSERAYLQAKDEILATNEQYQALKAEYQAIEERLILLAARGIQDVAETKKLYYRRRKIHIEAENICRNDKKVMKDYEAFGAAKSKVLIRRDELRYAERHYREKKRQALGMPSLAAVVQPRQPKALVASMSRLSCLRRFIHFFE